MNVLNIFRIRKHCRSTGWNRLMCVFMRRMIKEIVVQRGGSESLPTTYNFFNTSLSMLTPHVQTIIWEESFARRRCFIAIFIWFCFRDVFGNVQEKRDELKLNEIYQLLVDAGDGKLVGRQTGICYKKYRSIISCL